MQRNLLVLFLVAALTFSCSSDKDEDKADENKIEGTWDAIQLVIDDSTASDDAKNGRDILNFLTAKDCFILTLTFNQDLSLITENSVNYLEINVNAGGTGLDIPCPTENDMETTTYTYDGKVLTFLDDNGQTVTVDATVSGDTMTVNASDLDIPNFNESGQLIFEKR